MNKKQEAETLVVTQHDRELMQKDKTTSSLNLKAKPSEPWPSAITKMAAQKQIKNPLGRALRYGDYIIARWDNCGLVTVDLSPDATASGKVLHETLALNTYTDISAARTAIDELDPSRGTKVHAKDEKIIYDRRADEWTNSSYEWNL